MDPPMDTFYRDWQFTRGAAVAATRDDLDAVKWFCTEYSTGKQVTEGAYAAADNGHLEIIKWLREEYHHAPLDMMSSHPRTRTAM